MRFRKTICLPAVILLLGAPAWSGQARGPQPGQRPTLGPPTLNGPTSAHVSDRSRLLRVHNIYVDRIDNGLGLQVGEELTASKRFKVVEKMRDADSVLRGSCFGSRRLRSLHSEVFLTDRVTGKSIWQDDVRQALDPPPLKEAVHRTANLVVRHLIESVVKAEQP